jgi:hypothetical protein
LSSHDATKRGWRESRIDCDGLKNEHSEVFEEVWSFDGYKVTPYNTGTPEAGRQQQTRSEQGSVMLMTETGGDANEYYWCRITQRATLVCFMQTWDLGMEFKKMPVTTAQRCHPLPNEGLCVP